MLTVDFDRLGVEAGDRVLDMGCGAGRHAFELYRRGTDVVAFDQDADELSAVSDMFAAMRAENQVPDGAAMDQFCARQEPFVVPRQHRLDR